MEWIAAVSSSRAPATSLLVQLMVGGVFLSEGIQKFLFPDELGVGRFLKIGIPASHSMVSFADTRRRACEV